MVYAKLAAAGAIITGILGWIIAINAMMASNELAAGIILAASAVAFGMLLLAVVPREKN